MQEKICIRVNGMNVYGTLHIPENAKNVPCLVHCHGFTGNSNDRIDVTMGRTLEANGIAMLRIDCRGSGSSDGDFRDVTVASEVEDIEAAIRYVSADPRIDSKRIAVSGHSLGGLTALTVSYRNRGLAGTILMSPALTCYHELIQLLTGETLKHFMKTGEMELGGFVTGKKLIDELSILEPYRMVREYEPKHALMVHGSCDGESPVYNSVRVHELWPNSELCLVDGSDHCYRSVAWLNEAVHAIVGFMTRL